MTRKDVFEDNSAVLRGLKTLINVGLGYLTLGQSATELSGGEAQRIKLASELKRAQNNNTLYVLDEPTTGLHLSDTALLLEHLSTLVDSGNTVVMVEHNMQVAAASDHVIDMGPGAGEDGGPAAEPHGRGRRGALCVREAVGAGAALLR